jgi:hypothetical protein
MSDMVGYLQQVLSLVLRTRMARQATDYEPRVYVVCESPEVAVLSINKFVGICYAKSVFSFRFVLGLVKEFFTRMHASTLSCFDL